MSIKHNIGVPISSVNRNPDMIFADNTGMTIGQRIKKTRAELGMTQQDLADKTGLTQPTLSELERGDSASSSYLPAIAAALGVSALWLQKEQGPKYPIRSITQRELTLITAYREATEEGKTFIEMACKSAPKSHPGRTE